MIFKETFSGTPYQIGQAYGRAYHHIIGRNVSWMLVAKDSMIGEKKIPAAEKWFRAQRERHFDEWPWLADEMKGIASGSGVPLDFVQQLNFRVWQYNFYGTGHCCSSFVAHAKDGTVITGGTLDDPRDLYVFCEFRPKKGFRQMTFPIAGTCWANRGMNDAGLVLGISSLPLSKIKFDPLKIYQQDLCIRIIFETCSTVAQVRDFCDRYPFFMHILAVDANGDSLAIGACDNGANSYPDETLCLTNHAFGPLWNGLKKRGYDGTIPSKSSKPRLQTLDRWIKRVDGKLTLAEARTKMAEKKGWPASINNPSTAFAILAQPQKDRKTLWISDKPVTPDGFLPFRFK
jgi:hypothetical protein